MLYERRHTREIAAYRGVWKAAPVLGGLFLVAIFAGIGLPGFSGFVGEFLSLLGTFVYDKPYAIVATLGVILAAVYGLWAFQRAFTGKPSGENAKMQDITFRELVVVVPLLALSLFLGLYPKPALDRIEPSVEGPGREPREEERLPRTEAARDREEDPSSRRRQASDRRARAHHHAERRLAGASRPRSTLGLTAVLVVLARALLRRRPEATPVAYVDHRDRRSSPPRCCSSCSGTTSRTTVRMRTMAGMVRVDGFGVFLGIVVLIATTHGDPRRGRLPAARSSSRCRSTWRSCCSRPWACSR